MKFALALGILAAFTGYAHAKNPYVPYVNQYVPKPVPGPGPCIQCGTVQLKPDYGNVVNPVQKYVPGLANKSAVR